MVRALIEINRNNPSEAINLLQPLTQYEAGGSAALLPAYIRGLAYLRGQKGAEAAAEFQKVIDFKNVVAVPLLGDPPLYPLAFLNLARSAVLIGDTAKARSAYQDFLNLWKQADPEIPLLIAAKKEYEHLQ
jgi:tetratricopeptide (TPR) repeat protein